jgi:hypothetical protein
MFVFLGALKVLNIRENGSVNVGTQVLTGLKSTTTTKIGGAMVVGDGTSTLTPIGVNQNNDATAASPNIQ